MCFFKKKKIVKVVVEECIESISQDEQMLNYANGHMMGGFEGVFMANLINENSYPETVFLIFYDDGSTKRKRVKNNSYDYKYYRTLANNK